MSVSVNLLPANVTSIETDATGWTAGTNTARSQSTRFYVGTKSLQLTATATGTVSATTASRVAVTAGDVLTAYAYAANVAAATGRALTVSVSWWGGVTGGTALSTSTSTAVTLPSGTTWTTPPPILIATVPAGAAYASVTVSVTGVAASASVVVDAIALGPPAAVTGNLVPYSVASVEVDATGWQSLLQATIGRSSTASWEGWYALSLTTAGTGTIRAGMVGSVPVTPGTEYFAYAWAYPPADNSTLTVTLRWLDASGTLLSSTSAPWTIATGLTWGRRAVIGTAPAGAASARLVLEPSIATVGDAWLFDQMAITPSPRLPGTLLGYGAQSIEVDTSAWSAVSGCTIARSNTWAFDGVFSLKVTCAGGDATVQLAQPVAVTARQSYKVAPTIYVPASCTVDVQFTWLNSAGATVSTVSSHWNLTGGAGWYAPPASAVAPAGATALSAAVRMNGAAVGDLYYIDNIFAGPGGLGVLADAIPGAYGATISVQGLTTSGYTYWGLWRVGPDGTQTPIRGDTGDTSQSTITGDVAVLEDYEAPLGVPIRYRVKLWTPPTAYQAGTSASVTLMEPPETDIVIKDPALPARWVQASVETMPDWSRAARQGVNPVRRRPRPIVISDVRQSRTGTLTLTTESAEDRDQLWWVLESGNTLLLQWPSSAHEPDMYVAVGDAGEAHIVPSSQYTDRTWSVPLVEVDRPAGGIVGSATRTWQSVLDESPDWLTVMSTYTSWLDVLTGVRGS